MFVVLKENEGGLTIGVNEGNSSFGSSFDNQRNNHINYHGQPTQGCYGVAYHTTPNQAGYTTFIPLNTGSFQGNAGAVYGNTLDTESAYGGTGTFSTGSHLGANAVGYIPHPFSAFTEVTPVATYTPSNTMNTLGFAGSEQQTSAGGDFGTQKTLTVNLTDNDQSYCIECFSPEFDTKNSDVTLTPNGLRIRVSNENGTNTDTGFYTIPTPCDVDTDKITAHSSKGYLKITLPRSKKALESFKKIKVD